MTGSVAQYWELLIKGNRPHWQKIRNLLDVLCLITWCRMTSTVNSSEWQF